MKQLIKHEHLWWRNRLIITLNPRPPRRSVQYPFHPLQRKDIETLLELIFHTCILLLPWKNHQKTMSVVWSWLASISCLGDRLEVLYGGIRDFALGQKMTSVGPTQVLRHGLQKTWNGGVSWSCGRAWFWCSDWGQVKGWGMSSMVNLAWSSWIPCTDQSWFCSYSIFGRKQQHVKYFCSTRSERTAGVVVYELYLWRAAFFGSAFHSSFAAINTLVSLFWHRTWIFTREWIISCSCDAHQGGSRIGSLDRVWLGVRSCVFTRICARLW